MVPDIMTPGGIARANNVTGGASRASIIGPLAQMMNSISPAQRAALMMATPGNYPRRNAQGGPDVSEQAIADWLIDQGTRYVDFWAGGAGPGAGGNIKGVSLGLPMVISSVTAGAGSTSAVFNLAAGIGSAVRDGFLALDDPNGIEIDTITNLSIGSQPFSLGPQNAVKAAPVLLSSLLNSGESPFARPLYIGDLAGNEQITMTVTFPSATGGEVVRLLLLAAGFGGLSGPRQVLSAVQASDPGDDSPGILGGAAGILGRIRQRAGNLFT